MAKEDKKEQQKSALGKGLAEVLARTDGPGQEGEAEEKKDVKTQAQEFLLSVEDRIKTVSGKDVDITDVEIEYLQARTAFAVGNFQGALDYLEKINDVLEKVEKEAQEAPPAPEEEAPPPPEDEAAEEEEEEEEEPPAPPEEDDEDPPPPPEEETPAESEEEEEVLPEDKPMVFCMMCGEKITDDSLFCNWCGEKVQ